MKSIIHQIIFFIIIIGIWQLTYEMQIFSPLLFPSVNEVIEKMIYGFKEEQLLLVIGYSLSLIIKGMVIGIFVGFVLSAISLIFKPFKHLVKSLIAICDPLPGIALLPLTILWFGIGEATIIFIIVYSVVWPVSRSILDGVSATPNIYVEVGRNMGLNKYSVITGVYMPSSLPYIISGIKIGWARAWRALIAAEMIFGVSGAVGGLGWYIFTKRYQLETASVFSSLIIIMIIGIVVEYLIFEMIEKKTIKKWGMVQK